jgi:hypothetical protein
MASSGLDYFRFDRSAAVLCRIGRDGLGGPELIPLARKLIAILLLMLSGCLLWYSISTYKLSGQSRLADFSARFFPEALILDGNSRYRALDSAGAEESYKQAILAGPSFVDAWIGLARAQLGNGQIDQTRETLNIISPALTSISAWKRSELLLAYDLHDESYFEQCFNYILSYLPHRVEEAGLLASQFWGGWPQVVPHVLSYNRPVLMGLLINGQQADTALDVFNIMQKEGANWEDRDLLRLCDFLISKDRFKEAKEVWRIFRKNDLSFIHDGGFEQAPLNMAFGWRVPTNTDFVVERTTDAPYSGKFCLHAHFKGTGNVDANLAYQVVPVDSGASYTLRFVRKSRNLTTDRGVYVMVYGFKFKGEFSVKSGQVLGDSPWKEEEIQFTVPSGCEAIVLQVLRDQSLKMDNKISGDYWLDSVELDKSVISTNSITKYN